MTTTPAAPAQPSPFDTGIAALQLLVSAVRRNPGCGQTQRIARFLLGLYNGRNHPFDLTNLRGLDGNLRQACLDALALDSLGLGECHTWFKNGDRIWQEMQRDYSASPKWRKASREYLAQLASGGLNSQTGLGVAE